MVLLDLRDRPGTPLFDPFVALYVETFTIPGEREDPEQWRERLLTELPPPEPKTHLLVAVPEGGEDGRAIVGGLVFEYYRESRCGLLTYLVVDEDHRRRGVARKLLARAIETLEADAQYDGRRLAAVFAEVDDPDRVSVEESSIPPAERLRAIGGFARRVAIPYVQPELIGGSARERRMLLLSVLRPGQDPEKLPAEVVFGFLHEFYRALRVEEPERDPDFQAMRASCGTEVALEPIAAGRDER